MTKILYYVEDSQAYTDLDGALASARNMAEHYDRAFYVVAKSVPQPTLMDRFIDRRRAKNAKP